MTEELARLLSFKFVGPSSRPIEDRSIAPGTTVAECLTSLGLDSGFTIKDPNRPETVFSPTDDLYAMTPADSYVYSVVALVDAGGVA